MVTFKDKTINDLKMQVKNSDTIIKPINFNDIIVINFFCSGKNLVCGIKCLKTDIFAEVEERLYQKYQELRETNNNFLTKGKLVLRFKKICDNNIQDGDVIQLLQTE